MKKNLKNKILWCLKQKRGIKLANPNENLINSYLKKSKSSLNMLDAAVERKEYEWIVTTSYYAYYFSFYALLQKIGIKSEIHECSIYLMKFLFVEENILSNSFFEKFLLSKEYRINIQYYISEYLDLKDINELYNFSFSFVLKMEELIEILTEEKILFLRNKLKALI